MTIWTIFFEGCPWFGVLYFSWWWRWEKKIKIITKDLDIPIDGLTKYGDDYIVSTWSGGIYIVNGKNGEVEEIFGDNFNTADILYSKDLNLLLVPDFAHNIVAFRLNKR